MKTRRELKRDHKETTPPMGVFVVRNTRNGRFQVHASRNLQAGMNRLRFEITPSTNPNVALQADWRTMGPGAFELEVLDVLEPRKDVPGWDPADDLEQLRALWHDRLAAQGATPY